MKTGKGKQTGGIKWLIVIPAAIAVAAFIATLALLATGGGAEFIEFLRQIGVL